MSPEQATGGRELDERSDIYSLGAVAYYLLTGRPPFDGEGGIEVMIAHARDPVVPPSQVRAGIPEDLERVVLAVPGQGPGRAVPGCREPGAGPRAVPLRRGLGPGAAARWWREADAGDPSEPARGGSLASDR